MEPFESPRPRPPKQPTEVKFMELSESQKITVIDYYVRNVCTKSILEDEGGFGDISRVDIERFMNRCANSLKHDVRGGAL